MTRINSASRGAALTLSAGTLTDVRERHASNKSKKLMQQFQREMQGR